MTNNNYYWMKYAIKIADKIDSELIRVSALVVNNDQLIEYSSTNNRDCAWADNLIIKLKNKKITKIENLYLTINTLNDKEEFTHSYLKLDAIRSISKRRIGRIAGKDGGKIVLPKKTINKIRHAIKNSFFV